MATIDDAFTAPITRLLRDWRSGDAAADAMVLSALGKTDETSSEFDHAAEIFGGRPWIDLDALRCLETLAVGRGPLAATAASLLPEPRHD